MRLPLSRSFSAERWIHHSSSSAVCGRSARLASDSATDCTTAPALSLFDRTREQARDGRVRGQVLQLVADRALDEVVHLRLAERAPERAQQVAHRAAEARDVRRVLEPLEQQRARRDPREPGADHLGRQPLVLHHRDDALDDLLAPVRDDRGVRDRDAERVAEQRRHREPVGEPADHGRLEARGDDREPGRAGERARARAPPATRRRLPPRSRGRSSRRGCAAPRRQTVADAAPRGEGGSRFGTGAGTRV